MNGGDAPKTNLNPAAIRARFEHARGKEYWRSLDELAETPEFQEFLNHEFPRQSGLPGEGIDRRQAMKIMGASLALAGLAGCAYMPPEKILPYVRQPEELVPGKPLFFATSMPFGGYGKGIVVESHEGRPTKIEGNAQHPASLGATDTFGQASVLTLYDPDRAQTVTRLGLISTWSEFSLAVNVIRAEQQIKKGAGLRFLTETVTSPTLAGQLQALLKEFPQAKWHQYEAVGRDAVKSGSRLAFGEVTETQYRFERADIILALDSDFLISGPGCVRYARDFARRRLDEESSSMNRLYVLEGTPSLTGAMADHRLAVRSGSVEAFALAFAQAFGIEVGPGGSNTEVVANAKWVAEVVRDLQNHRGSSLIVAGEQQPPLVHALAHAMNERLGNIGKTVVYTAPVEASPVLQGESLRDLVSDMNAGRVETLVILGGNPMFTAPADLSFADALQKVKLRIHLGLYEDETSNLCHWHLPEAHYLEAWSDIRAFDGTASILQPLVAPLYNGRSAHEVLSLFQGNSNKKGYDIVREYWKTQIPPSKPAEGTDPFEGFWQTSLFNGVVAGSAFPPKPLGVKTDSILRELQKQASSASSSAARNSSGSAMEIVFRPDPTVWDGSFANNGWLQELPKPLSKLTWDNVVWISPATAQRLSLTSGDVVRVQFQGREVKAPVWIQPGHVDDSVTVYFGYGRPLAGRVGGNVGFNGYAIRTSEYPWIGVGVALAKTGEQVELACTQNHHSMEGRNLVRFGTLEEYRKNPEFVREMEETASPLPSLYPGFKETGYSWGMAVNLNSCIGCNACVVACQAENNTPVVGKTEVIHGREMHWIRIDRYYEGGVEQPRTSHEPVMCMHCENAPCEVVCPVGATNHSEEGLNQMVYNRCVGTRYCSNNCPYKVRRFNFFQFGDWETESLKLQRNPNVTVRSRGVMEKCTYCVQRINAAKIQAEEENREVRDGEIITACQAACPTDAIVFGNLNDPNSRASTLKAHPLNYGLLTELTTKPRTTYLARLRNPNPEIETV